MASKLSKLSGFPEWLPEEQLVERELCNRVRKVYESHGFTPVETPAVELMETLLAKGVEGKELYGLQRYGAEPDGEPGLGLHFDLTVPFARYTALHLNDLDFPFRRYQLQKVWRGERPQKGRFREFYQFDADVVAREMLPLCCDAEMVSLFVKALKATEVGEFEVVLNNRKILLGLFESLKFQPAVFSELTTIIDKREKIGDEASRELLLALEGGSESQSDELLEAASRSFSAASVGQLREEDFSSDVSKTGVRELQEIIALIPESLRENISVHYGLARGLDYYTGIIIEGRFSQYPEFGSVGGGGRYDGLVSQYLKTSVPGVGISLGISRMMDLILRHKLFPTVQKSCSELLVTVLGEDDRSRCIQLAEELRNEGINVEVFYKSPKLGKQIDYAAKKGIPYVLFYEETGSTLRLKNVNTGEQTEYEGVREAAKAVRRASD